MEREGRGKIGSHRGCDEKSYRSYYLLNNSIIGGELCG